MKKKINYINIFIHKNIKNTKRRNKSIKKYDFNLFSYNYSFDEHVLDVR